MLKSIIAGAALVAVAATGTLYAQVTPAPGGIKRTILQKADVPGANFEIVFGIAEFPAGATVGRHTHPGAVMAYVLEGEFSLLVDGQPGKSLKAGEAFQVPAGVIHDERGGGVPAKVMAVYVLPKGQPVATPVK